LIEQHHNSAEQPRFEAAATHR